MKRTLTIILVILIAASLFSCKKTEEKHGEDGFKSKEDASSVLPTPEKFDFGEETTAPIDSAQPEIIPTASPAVYAPQLAYIVKTDKTNKTITVTNCTAVNHFPDDLDEDGNPYGYEWLEVVHESTSNTYTVADDAVILFGNLEKMQSGNLQNDQVTVDYFFDNAAGKHNGQPLYFNLTITDGIVTGADLWIAYYFAG